MQQVRSSLKQKANTQKKTGRSILFAKLFNLINWISSLYFTKASRERKKAKLVLKTWKETNYRTEFVFHVPDSFLDREISVFFPSSSVSSSNNMKKDNKIYFCISIPRHVNNLLVSPFICSKNASFFVYSHKLRCDFIHYYFGTQKTTQKTKGGKKFTFVSCTPSKSTF